MVKAVAVLGRHAFVIQMDLLISKWYMPLLNLRMLRNGYIKMTINRKVRAYYGRENWTAHEPLLREHYLTGTCTNEEFAKSLGRSLKSVEAKAVRLEIKRGVEVKPVPPDHYYRAGTTYPNNYTMRHIL